ncbi:MAG TPA: heparan-alpha-glucosaminide N-acetyltransferase domain-containing protein [Steroidobacteraceae bacterium]
MPPLANRFRAIDVLRGLTVALMIVVNMQIGPGRSYVPLLHAPWNGLTPTDVVFPTFLFVVGAALSFTLGKYAALGDAAFLRKVATRTALIFLCGFLLYWFPFYKADTTGHFGFAPLSQTRVFGVLQRIAIGYGVASLIIYYGGRVGAIAFSVIALLGYWALMHAYGDYSMAGSAEIRFDKWVLGEAHMYHGEGVAFDPEGILSTLPSMVNVLAGYLAARFVRERGTSRSTLVRLLLAGAFCVGLALWWDTVFPINKKIWTSSFVLCTVGIDLVVLAILICVVPEAQERRWTYFFEVFGRNTLAIYLLAELGQTVLETIHIRQITLYEWLWATGFAPWAGDKPGSLLCAVAYMLGCWVVAYAMDRRRIYIKL